MSLFDCLILIDCLYAFIEQSRKHQHPPTSKSRSEIITWMALSHSDLEQSMAIE